MGDGAIARLQELLDDSAKHAGPHLRSTFEIPDHTLTAEQLVRRLDKSVSVALATVSARNEPRVTPVDAVFHAAAFHIPTVASAARITHIARQPAVSLTHWIPDEIAIIVHGRATVLDASHADFGELEKRYDAWAARVQRPVGQVGRASPDRP